MIEHKQLLTGKYYTDRLSLFMKESVGICDQMDIFYTLIVEIDKIYDELFDYKNIFSTNYSEAQLAKKRGIFNQVGSFFNCQRKFTITNATNQTSIAINFPDTEQGDKEFLIYIKCQIIKQNFQGTREELAKLYKTYDEGILSRDVILPEMIIFYIHEGINVGSANCNIYWVNGNDFSSNLKNLFGNGYLTIESMGIRYNRYISNILEMGKFFELSNHSGSFIPAAKRGTGNPPSPVGIIGDIYLKVDSNNNALAFYKSDGTQWVQSYCYQFADGYSEESGLTPQGTHGAKFA